MRDERTFEGTSSRSLSFACAHEPTSKVHSHDVVNALVCYTLITSRSEVSRNDCRFATLGAQHLRSTSKPTRFVGVFLR